ncbi:MAG: hypothetical protein V1811_01605 [Candidatus Micrarchaeota archaeon]
MKKLVFALFLLSFVCFAFAAAIASPSPSAPAPSQATPSFAQQFGVILLAIVILLAFLFVTQRAEKPRARHR